MQPYDILGVVAVIEGAGGVVTDWDGSALGLGGETRVVAAANPALHERAAGLDTQDLSGLVSSGIMASTSISISSSGRASPFTISPVEQG